MTPPDPQRRGPAGRRARRTLKRAFDIGAALVGLAIAGPVIVAATLAARRDTGASGLFRQQRLGRGGKRFWLYKVRTMRVGDPGDTTATAANDPRITPLGRRLRKWKIDELPQLWNVLVGEMSFVGPRPEVPQHLPMYLRLAPEVLGVRPGVTGPATLLYRDEERLLAHVADVNRTNETLLLPDKLRLNADYARGYTLGGDLVCLVQTLTGTGPRYRRLQDIPQQPHGDAPRPPNTTPRRPDLAPARRRAG